MSERGRQRGERVREIERARESERVRRRGRILNESPRPRAALHLELKQL